MLTQKFISIMYIEDKKKYQNNKPNFHINWPEKKKLNLNKPEKKNIIKFEMEINDVNRIRKKVWEINKIKRWEDQDGRAVSSKERASWRAVVQTLEHSNMSKTSRREAHLGKDLRWNWSPQTKWREISMQEEGVMPTWGWTHRAREAVQTCRQKVALMVGKPRSFYGEMLQWKGAANKDRTGWWWVWRAQFSYGTEQLAWSHLGLV